MKSVKLLLALSIESFSVLVSNVINSINKRLFWTYMKNLNNRTLNQMHFMYHESNHFAARKRGKKVVIIVGFTDWVLVIYWRGPLLVDFCML